MTQSVDVLIVGAGLSGIGAACHLQSALPHKTLAIVESRDGMGGTWDLFRYPGIRSDSDMYTLGYRFKPWTNPKAIADGPAIRSYIIETAKEKKLDRLIRYDRKLVAANWRSEQQQWEVQLRSGDGQIHTISCQWLYMCAGYYSYTQPYRPQFEGQENFCGSLFHAQHWPQELDYKDKRVVVVGSGATAVTLVPELAKSAAGVTMLQRSPSYVASVPGKDAWVTALRGFLPFSAVYFLVRWKRIFQQLYLYTIARRRPATVKRYLLKLVRAELGQSCDVDRHFTPRYKPWEQRLCAVPDGDLFTAIRSGRADIVTDEIAHFVDNGLVLKSGQKLDADIVVLATGLNLVYLGEASLTVAGKPVKPADEYLYRGVMLSNVPNMIQTFGYTNSSWTLKADLTAEYACRLMTYMDAQAKRSVVARSQQGLGAEPMLDFSSGYIQRSMAQFPRQGRGSPWRVHQNYFKDIFSLRYSRIVNSALEFQ